MEFKLMKKKNKKDSFLKTKNNQLVDEKITFLNRLQNETCPVHPIKQAWLKDKSFLKACLKKEGKFILQLPEHLKIDEELMSIAVNHRPVIATMYPWNQNRTLVETAIKNNPHILLKIDNPDYELMKLAVKNSLGVFQNLKPKCANVLDYYRIYRELVNENPHLYFYGDETIQNNPEFIQNILDYDITSISKVPLRYIKSHFQYMEKAYEKDILLIMKLPLQIHFFNFYFDKFIKHPQFIGKYAIVNMKEKLLEEDGMLIHFWDEQDHYFRYLAMKNQFKKRQFFLYSSGVYYKNMIFIPSSNETIYKIAQKQYKFYGNSKYDNGESIYCPYVNLKELVLKNIRLGDWIYKMDIDSLICITTTYLQYISHFYTKDSIKQMIISRSHFILNSLMLAFYKQTNLLYDQNLIELIEAIYYKPPFPYLLEDLKKRKCTDVYIFI